MTTKQLAKKALEHIKNESFTTSLDSWSGGKCDGGYCESTYIDLSRNELLYLIKECNVHKELFQGLKLEKIDVDSILAEMAKESAWPDGGPCAKVNDVIPIELSDLSKEIESLDETNEEEVKAIREKLLQVSDGKYTFHFTVEASDYCFDENAKESIDLSAKEALGLLYWRHGDKQVFEGICNESFDNNDIDYKAYELGFAEDYDTFDYGGYCQDLEAYLEAWNYILNAIISKEITEENLDTWLKYFDDAENYESRITEWYEYRN